MNRFLGRDGRQFWFAHLEPPFVFAPPFDEKPYVCLLWDAGSDVDAEAMSEVASVLVDSNCRYVLTGGHRCETWHDVIDEVFLSKYPADPELEEHFMMTTSHSDQPVSEVAFAAIHTTDFDDHVFGDYLVLLLCGDAALESELKTCLQREDQDRAAV